MGGRAGHAATRSTARRTARREFGASRWPRSTRRRPAPPRDDDPGRQRRSALVRGSTAKEIALSTVKGEPARAHHPTAEVDRRASEPTPTLEIVNREQFCRANGGALQRQGLRPRLRLQLDRGHLGRARRSAKPVSGNDVTTTITLAPSPGQRRRHRLTVTGSWPSAARPTEDTVDVQPPRRHQLRRRDPRRDHGRLLHLRRGRLRLHGRHRRPRRAARTSATARRTRGRRASRHGRSAPTLYDPEFTRSPPTGDSDRVPGLQRRDHRRTSPASRNGGDRRPQLAQARRRAVGEIDVVFMSIGGNDAGFGDVIIDLHASFDCTADSCPAPGLQRGDAAGGASTCSDKLPRWARTSAPAQGNVRHARAAGRGLPDQLHGPVPAAADRRAPALSLAGRRLGRSSSDTTSRGDARRRPPAS